jgi:cyclopropane fatty-acyl-phospholipid synthase-like methyltransferase
VLSPRIPYRTAWAVAQLDLAANDRILEIGCGSGIAVSLMCEHLHRGHVTAIDRSATAIRRATQRNETHIGTGRATFHQVDLADYWPTATRIRKSHFDKIVAINVSLFWAQPAALELLVARRMLTRGTGLHLVYQTAHLDRATRLAEATSDVLARHGFAAQVAIDPNSPLVHIGTI